MVRSVVWILVAVICSGCVSIPLPGSYAGPEARPLDLSEYYKVENSFTESSVTERGRHDSYSIKRIELNTAYGPVTIDYFQRPTPSDSLIFVFPILGGKNIIEKHFADYFAQRGIETAIVHRSNEFKKPENYWKIEEVFRKNVLRDRLAIDYFEQQHGKKKFGTFGISRGAINASVTAGVDKRLQYNVFALGGADLINVFRDSQERGIKKYRRKVLNSQKINEEQFYRYLRENLKTDPKFVAGHIDARNTLMFLSVFDSSVPFEYGLQLRARIGNPKTIFLLSGHYTALAYTQFVRMVPPTNDYCVFPLDYVESESLAFYQEKFENDGWQFRHYAIRVLQAPFQFVSDLFRIVIPD
jgi:hypothetical protein